MNVPGVNVLGLALAVISPQGFHLFPFVGNVRQPTGVDLPTYGSAKPSQGSIQPVPRRNYETLGLDMAKEYVTLFTPVPVRAIERDGAGDVFVYGGKYYHAQDRTNWLQQDGWNEVLGVAIPALASGQVNQ